MGTVVVVRLVERLAIFQEIFGITGQPGFDLFIVQEVREGKEFLAKELECVVNLRNIK